MIERRVSVKLEPTPKELAREFAAMGNHEQAEFFNTLAEELDSWSMQLQYVRDSVILSNKGLALMKLIGEYGD